MLSFQKSKLYKILKLFQFFILNLKRIEISFQLKDLIQKLLNKDPTKRLNIDKIKVGLVNFLRKI